MILYVINILIFDCVYIHISEKTPFFNKMTSFVIKCSYLDYL